MAIHLNLQIGECQMNKVNNPIIPGFSPDPSVCAVGDDYYLVNSTFSYFPGVPIYHSKDLGHWEQIGNVLDRESQVDLRGVEHSEGIFAPTIRYHQGTFYMITTNMTKTGRGGNFYVTAKDPRGPWSEPIFLEDAKGFDPSLFFDEDGKCYYVGTRSNSEGETYGGDNEIWAQELDLEKKKLTGESYRIWKGALNKVIWAEGPHLYKIGEYYYLLIAEGGTSYGHSVTAARSKTIFGEYEGNPYNPIATHRHLGPGYPITNVGHGDLVQAKDGEWYMVLLASRPVEGSDLLGRETFLAKVSWHEDWPVVNPGIGLITDNVALSLEKYDTKMKSACVHFEGEIDKRLLFLRNPDKKSYSLSVRRGFLRLFASEATLQNLESPAYIGLRQQHFCYSFSVKMQFSPSEENDEEGIAFIQNNAYFLRLVCRQRKGKNVLALIQVINGEESILKEVPVEEKTLYLKMIGDKITNHFYYSTDGMNDILVQNNVDVSKLCTESAGGFVGNTMGIYASSNHAQSSGFADFAWMEYMPINTDTPKSYI